MNDKHIKQGFEDMSPSAEAKERMLANILEQTAATEEQQAPAPLASQKKRSPWKIALPLAACLILLAGMGVFAYSTYSDMLSNFVAQESAADKQATGSAEESMSGSTREKELPLLYPIVLSDEVGRLYLLDAEDASLSTADPSLVGNKIGEATATSEDGSESISCTVYEYPHELPRYAIKYQGEQTYYLAAPFAR